MSDNFTITDTSIPASYLINLNSQYSGTVNATAVISIIGTAAEITPVSEIDKFKFNVCELIKDLSKSYQNLVRKKAAA